MQKTAAILCACAGVLALLGTAGCSRGPAKKGIVGDPAVIADDFGKAANHAADFIGTLRDKEAASREEGKVNRLLADVLQKRGPYETLVAENVKRASSPAERTMTIPPEAKQRADQAAARFDRELTRFQTLLGTQQTGK